MIDIFLGGVLPIFAIGAIGYAMGRYGTFDVPMAAAINRFVLYVGIPSLVFRLIAQTSIEELNPNLLLGFLISELAMYGCGFAIGKFMFKTDAKEAVLLGLACALTNHILFVLPIAITLFGEAAAAPIIAIITMDSILLFGGTLIVMDIMTSTKAAISHVLAKIGRNPPVVAVLIGLAVAFGNVDVPGNIFVFLNFVGSAAAPCALFAVGIILSQPQSPGRAMLPLVISAVKLLVHPVLAWLLLVTLFDLPLAISKPAMMVAAAPCGAMAFVLALNYQVRVDAISRAMLYSSVGSLITITLAAAL